MWRQRLQYGLYGVGMLGMYLFSRGFLLVRKQVTLHSDCQHPPTALKYTKALNVDCWLPLPLVKRPRLVILLIDLIDALRTDFAVPDAHDRSAYRNRLTVLWETALSKTTVQVVATLCGGCAGPGTAVPDAPD